MVWLQILLFPSFLHLCSNRRSFDAAESLILTKVLVLYLVFQKIPKSSSFLLNFPSVWVVLPSVITVRGGKKKVLV